MPPEFLARMNHLLGADYDAFAASYTQPPHMGLRVNTLKVPVADFISKWPFALKPVGAYAPAGFLVTDESKPGSHPAHAAGLYYLQEPSAMAVAPLVDPQPGEWVLDIAAAPGGKATHLAALLGSGLPGSSGLLVANDIDAKRAGILVENLERWGVRNALVTNAHPEHLAQQFGPVFDKVLVDAPCSGEGMFRRLGAFDWSQTTVLACARRQTAVLATAAQLVKPGGRLIYATCTFAPEENEMVIARFLQDHADFALVDPPRHQGFDRGRPSWVGDDLPGDTLDKTIRLWPHRFPGEGHFIAVMQRTDTKKPARITTHRRLNPGRLEKPQASDLKAWRAFAQATLRDPWPEERMRLRNGRLTLLPEEALETGTVKCVRYGLLLGECRKGYFKPAHALALALRADDVVTAVDFPPETSEIMAYLSGHDLPLMVKGRKGWGLITVGGFPVGWGKIANGRVKNHYPHGLRQRTD